MGISLKDYLGFVASPVGSVINGAVGAVTNEIADKTSKKNIDKSIASAEKMQDKEMAFNAEQAQLNRDFQRDERLATQDYNSASSQIQRMLDAGINPNVAFSSGYSSAESKPMSGASASYSSGLAGSVLTTMAERQLKNAQISNLYANSLSTLVNTAFVPKRAKADVAKIYSEIGVNDFNKDLQERTFSLYKDKTRAEIKIMDETLNKVRNENLEILANINLKTAQRITELAKADLTNAQIESTKAQTELTNAQTEGTEIDNKLQQLLLEFSDITGIPVGAPETHVLFTLWSQGRMKDVSDKIALNASESDNPLSKSMGAIGFEGSRFFNWLGSLFTK